MSGGQVYRLYDAWANPLYYGSSRSVFGRLHTHTHRAWYPAVSMILVDWYPSRLIALAVERELILRDAPWYNDNGVTTPWDAAPIDPIDMPVLPVAPDRVPGSPARPVLIEREDDDIRPVSVTTPDEPPPPLPPSVVLNDVCRVFGDACAMSSNDLVDALCALPNSDYSLRFTYSKMVSQRELAALLGGLGIRPVRFRVGNSQMRGYRRDQLVGPLIARLDVTDTVRTDVTPSMSQTPPE